MLISQLYASLSSKASIGVLKDDAGNDITDNQSKVEAFNRFFSSVFTADNGIAPNIDRFSDLTLDDVHFSYDRIHKHTKAKIQ